MPESSDVSSGNQATAADYNNLRKDALKVWAQGSSELTIATGAITLGTDGFYTVDTESDASSDDLDTINGGEAGEIILLAAASAARTVVIKDATGNIQLKGGQDLPLANAEQVVMLRYDGTNWIELAGGGERLFVFGYSLGADGGGAIPDGVYGDIPYLPDLYLLALYGIADVSGSVTISVQNEGAFGVPAGPGSADEVESFVMTSVQTKSDTTLSGVTREQPAGTWRFEVDGAATTIEQVAVVALAVKL